MNTKGNLKPLPIEHYPVTSSDIVNYLANQLGFPFDCDFKIFDNRAQFEKPMAVEKCFVVMRCVFRDEDICVSRGTNDYVDKVLSAASAGKKFKDDVVAVLKDYMFPANIAQELRQNPAKAQELANQGLYGDRLDKIMRHPGFFYDEEEKKWGLYLRPERIIYDMCKDPDTDKLDGTMGFGYLNDAGGNAASITWGVNVYHKSGLKLGIGGISVEQIFANLK